jgi:hypothetical protein
MELDEFNNLLLETDDDDDEINNINGDNVCLITGEKLTEPHITLSCNHKFNYEPLYNDVKSHKSAKHNLRFTQMKCPYCRAVEDKILPYFKIGNVKRIFGVNHPMQYSILLNYCETVMKSGKRKGEMCGRMCNGSNCIYHKKRISKK